MHVDHYITDCTRSFYGCHLWTHVVKLLAVGLFWSRITKILTMKFLVLKFMVQPTKEVGKYSFVHAYKSSLYFVTRNLEISSYSHLCISTNGILWFVRMHSIYSKWFDVFGGSWSWEMLPQLYIYSSNQLLVLIPSDYSTL